MGGRGGGGGKEERNEWAGLVLAALRCRELSCGILTPEKERAGKREDIYIRKDKMR
jgi:hypothetical protein